MMNEEDGDQLRESVVRYRDEIGYVRGLVEPVRKLSETARLVERIIKLHFMPTDVEKPTLGPLLHSRKAFLGRALFPNAASAIDVRNRMLHDHPQGWPTDEELARATEALVQVAEHHCQELEKQIPTPRTLPSTPDSEIGEPEGQVHIATDRFSTAPESTAYATQIERRPIPKLDAVDADPQLTASTLAEYTFCPRAGILTHEGGFSDPEDELRLWPYFRGTSRKRSKKPTPALSMCCSQFQSGWS